MICLLLQSKNIYVLLQSKILIYVSVCRKFRRGVFLCTLNSYKISPVYRVTVPYAACIQLYPPEDEHLRIETCRGE